MTFNKKEWMKEYNSRPEIKQRKIDWRNNNRDKVREGNRKRNVVYNRRKIRFAPIGKQIILKDNPRKGICSKCGAIKGIDCKVTNLHHYGEYHLDDPLKDTIELCASCHAKEGWKMGSYMNKSKVTVMKHNTTVFIIALITSIFFVMPVGLVNVSESAKCEDIKYEGDPLKMPGKDHDDNNPSEKKFEKKVFGDATLCEVAFCHDNHECKGELKEHERDEVEETIMWMSGSEEQIECLEERYDLPDGGQEALQSYEVFDCAVGNY